MNKKSRLLELQLEKEKQLLQQKNEQLKYKYDVSQQKNKELNYFLQNIIKYIREISESENFRKFKKQIYDNQFFDSNMQNETVISLGKQVIELTDNYFNILEQIPQSELIYRSQHEYDQQKKLEEIEKIMQENNLLKQQLNESKVGYQNNKEFQITKNFEFRYSNVDIKSEIEIEYSINSLGENINTKINNSLLQSSQKNSVIDEDFSTPQFEIYKNNEQLNDNFQMQRGCSKNLQQELDKFLEKQGDSKVYIENDFISPQKMKKSSDSQLNTQQNISQDEFKELKELENMNILCSIDQDQNEHFEKIKKVYQNNPDLFCKFFNVSEEEKKLLIEKFNEEKITESNIQQNFTKKCNLISFQNIDNNMTVQDSNNNLYVNSCENLDNIEGNDQIQSIYSNRQTNLDEIYEQSKQFDNLTTNKKTVDKYSEQQKFFDKFRNKDKEIYNNQYVQQQKNSHLEEQVSLEKDLKKQINQMHLKNVNKMYKTYDQNRQIREELSQSNNLANTSIQDKSSDEEMNKVNLNISQRYGSNNADSFSQKLSVKKSSEKLDKLVFEIEQKEQENIKQQQQNNFNSKRQQKKLKMDFSPSITKKLQKKVGKIITDKQKNFQNKLNEKNNTNQNRLCLPFSYAHQQQQTKQRKSKINNQKSFKNLSNLVKKTKKMQKSYSFIDKQPLKKKKINISSSSDEDMQIVTKEVIPIEDIMRKEKPLKGSDYNQKRYKKSFKDFEKCFAKLGTKSLLKKFYQIILFQLKYILISN